MESRRDEALPLTSMRELVQRLEPLAQNVSHSDLIRFLRARDYDTGKAANLFVQHLKWRRSFGFVKEEEIKKELDKKLLFMQGHDKHGCPIIVILVARHNVYERDLEETKRLFVYCFDKAAASNSDDQGKFFIIADLGGWGLRNMDIKGYLAVLDILQNQYPERLRKAYLLNAPYLFWGAWKVVSPLVDKHTREKILFVEGKAVQETLLGEIDVDQLPDICGGKMALVPLQDSTTPNWPHQS